MTTPLTQEVIFIGLPGPTHHYGGLSSDNVASTLNQGCESSPREAALQAVSLMRHLRGLGVVVGVLPPQLRPHMSSLSGASPEQAPLRVLERASSSSAMWVANAATVTPAVDSGLLHVTTANLHSNAHRRIEAQDTHRVLAQLFTGLPDTQVHAPLDAAQGLLDEGAANHMRLAPSHSARGLHVFVYGNAPGRQSLSASQALAQQHGLSAQQVLFLEQNPEVIAEGVFHNDVIAVNNEYLLLVHEKAYAGGRADIARIEAAYQALHPGHVLQTIIVSDAELTVEEAVNSYLFNSQLITRPDGGMSVIAPSELSALYGGKAARVMQKICENPQHALDDYHMLDLRQSMRNGGGPACLRLRVPMRPDQISALSAQANVLISDALLRELEAIIERYYPVQMVSTDLRKPEVYDNCRALLQALSGLLRVELLPAV